MTNPPDPKTKTPLLHDKCPRCGSLAKTEMCGGNTSEYWCGSTDRWQTSDCELKEEIASLTRRLEEAEENLENSRILQREHLANSIAKGKQLTALRTAAEGARDALEQSYALALAWAGYYSGIHGGNGTPVPSHADILTRSQTALAALRAELDQADSNASNSPTASRESHG